MTAENMQSVAGLLSSFGANLSMVAGKCEQHGAAEVLMRTGKAWKCPRCLEAEMAADTHATWLATRSTDLMRTASIPAKYVGQRFTASTDDQRIVLRTVQQYRDFILREPAWAALILVGTTGTGKTLRACLLGQSLIAVASRSIAMRRVYAIRGSQTPLVIQRGQTPLGTQRGQTPLVTQRGQTPLVTSDRIAVQRRR